MHSCGGITRDEGLRCGFYGIKMRYELRSRRLLKGPSRPLSWLFHRRHNFTTACTKYPLDTYTNESPRDLWRKQHVAQNTDKINFNYTRNVTKLRFVVLISGTLRGFHQCARTIVNSLAKPNMPGTSLIVNTYDKNDCGGSNGHGLGMHMTDVNMKEISAAFVRHGMPVFMRNESTSRITALFKRYRQHPYSVFSPSVDRGAMVRYTSQFFLRQRAWEMASSLNSDVILLTRPDACIYGKWQVRHIKGDLLTVVLHVTLRDSTSCHVKLGANDVLLPYSDIHQGEWDDTFAVGFNSAIQKYVDLYNKLAQHAYVGSFAHPEALLKYHLQRVGLTIISACGAARGDMLEIVKKCST
jgi:hypothetical protein